MLTSDIRECAIYMTPGAFAIRSGARRLGFCQKNAILPDSTRKSATKVGPGAIGLPRLPESRLRSAPQ